MNLLNLPVSLSPALAVATVAAAGSPPVFGPVAEEEARPRSGAASKTADALQSSLKLLQSQMASCVGEAERRNVQITIDESSGIPIWLQLRNRLIYLISSGAFQVGDKLPTMRELAVEVGINYNTVSKVYQDIERDGYIISKRGRGTFVHDGYLGREGAASNPAESLADAFVRQCRELGVPRADILALVEEALEREGR